MLSLVGIGPRYLLLSSERAMLRGNYSGSGRLWIGPPMYGMILPPPGGHIAYVRRPGSAQAIGYPRR